ncbi:MAG: zinc ribbon domain-containing protein [Sulfuricurvum sp.]|nr:zinc ribbon domain-containing protein [Sulfuricurvum sp.]
MNKTCPKCQTENLTTAKFCKKCGSPLGDERNISNNTITDDKLYEIAMEEIENGTVQKGLYGRAFSESEGDKDKTDALYIKFRVQSLQDELILEAEQERALQEQQISKKMQQEEQQRLMEKKELESQLIAKAKANDILIQLEEEHTNKIVKRMLGILIVIVIIIFIFPRIQG